MPAKAGPHRVEFHVGRGVVRVGIVHGARVESVLPEVSEAAVQPVHVLRVHQVRAAQRFRQRLFPLGYHDQVNVIRHQAVCRHRQPVFDGALLEVGEIRVSVAVHKENVLPVIAALGNMMRRPRHHNPRLSSHDDAKLSQFQHESKRGQKVVTVPTFPSGGRAFSERITLPVSMSTNTLKAT